MFKVGQKVTVKRPVGQAADGDSPGGTYATPGETLVVRHTPDDRAWPIYVSHEHITDNSFGVTPDEIEAV